MKNNNKNKTSIFKSIGSMFSSLFRLGDKHPELTEVANNDEALLSPGRQIIKNFFANKFGVTGLIAFILIFVTVFGLSAGGNYSEFAHETTLQNLQPSQSFLKVKKDLNADDIVSISSGVSYSVALDKNGDVHFWGEDPGRVIVSDIVEKTKNKNIVQLVSGDRHVIALTDQNEIIGTGLNNFDQATVNYELNQKIGNKKIKKLGAGVSYSVVLLEDGDIHVWGSTLVNDMDVVPKAIQGNVVDFTTGTFNLLVKLNNGSMAAFGQANTPITQIPDEFKEGSIDVDSFAIATNTVLILDKNGALHTWGTNGANLKNLPEGKKFKSIDATRVTFLAITEENELITWGDSKFGLNDPTAEMTTDVNNVYGDYFQVYSLTDNNKINAWGNKGFILGSDELGRDIAERLIQGGRISLTVGAVSVLISTFIGVFVGLISGFYGGWIDNLLMRIAEVVSAFPFIPFAITLSAIMPEDTPQTTRLLMIMVILGIISWPGIARLVRGQILAEREKDFVLAARALGLKESTIIIKHILPSILNLVVVSMTLSYASSLLTEAGLSYLGFGVRLPLPSWGNMLIGVGNSIIIEHYWWRWLLPALCVMLTALSVNLIGDALRDAMDPKSNQQ